MIIYFINVFYSTYNILLYNLHIIVALIIHDQIQLFYIKNIDLIHDFFVDIFQQIQLSLSSSDIHYALEYYITEN